MKTRLPSFDQARVLVVGDVMLDRYWHGSTSRISPEAPVPVVKVGHIEDRAGGAANVALNIAALGAPVRLSGIIGADENGSTLEKCLRAAKVKPDFVIARDTPTITKLRVISRHQQLIRMDFEEAFSIRDAQALTTRMNRLLKGAKAVILSDYAKGTLPDPQQLIQAARAKKIPVFVDPKGSNFHHYRGATLLTPNLHEFEAVVGHCRTEAEIVQKGQALLKRLQLQALLVTRGEHGMTLLAKAASNRNKKSAWHLPVHAVEVYDVTGAGDTVISVLAAAVAAGESLPQAVALANIAAGIVVGKLGTATVTVHELSQALRGECKVQRGVVTEMQLQPLLGEAKQRGEKIVFTNGCFDILHAGHVAYLEEARRLGDRLVVAVNSDASVKKLKGEDRPVNPCEDRMRVLSGLASVDWVIRFTEPTPERLLKKLKPDVLAKGGDYAEDQVVGAPIVKGYGGEVKVLSLLANRSTTSVVNKIRRLP
jgi:D-beta-D-heptose 7-phosphate kinase/D-beta-D-heptose 1-phosphate adenosyltransferase